MTAPQTHSFSGTLAPATGALLAPALVNSTLLLVANNGVNPLTVKFGSLPTSATDGVCLDGASSPGGEGGSLVLAIEDKLGGDRFVPDDEVYGFSQLGTTFSVARTDGADGVTPFLQKHGYA